MINTTSKLPISYENPKSLAFLNGDPDIIGSRCISIDPDTDNLVIRKQVFKDIWQADSFEFGPDTVWIGKAAGLAAAGHHILTENIDGKFHLLPHSDFDGEVSQSDTKTLFSYYFSQNQISQADYSNEWAGTSFSWTTQSDTSGLLKKGYWKTGSTAATKPVTIKSYEGNDENGTVVFDQTYPASQFPANSEVETIEKGFIELSPGLDIYTVISSDEKFSLLTNADKTQPWNSIDICIVRYDNFLQTAEWQDGATYQKDQYFINNRQIFVCNTTGVQTGTFEDNSDKWDDIGDKYIENTFTPSAIPFAGSNGKLTEESTNLFYDEYNYLHTPKLVVSDDDPILKMGNGLGLISNSEEEFNIVHINTPTKSAFFKYDSTVDKFQLDKGLRVAAWGTDIADLEIENGGINIHKSDDKPYVQFFNSEGVSQGRIVGYSDAIEIRSPNGLSKYFKVDTGSGETFCYDNLLVSYDIIAENIELSGDLTSANSADWDTAYGWGDHSQVGYLTTEADPIFSASPSGGIVSQDITDWDEAYGWGDHSQVGYETEPFNGDIAEIYNSGGEFKIQPGAQGDVELFGDTDVDNSENSRMLYIRRQAAEGNDYIRMYMSSGRTGYIHSDRNLTLQGQINFTINSVTEDIFFKVGDNAGAKKFHFRDSDNNDVVTIDSNGVMTLDKNNGAYLNLVRGTVNKINNFFDSTYTDLRFEGDKDYNRIGTWINKPFQIVTNSINRIIIDQYGRVEIPSSLTVSDLEATDDILAYGDVAARNHVVRGVVTFNDKSTQIEAGERHFSQGHTHTAVYNNDWYDASSENISERDLHFSPDGLMMYIIGLASGGTGDCSIWEYQLTTPWDLSTVGTPTIESIETYGPNQVGLFINADGRRLWTVCTSNDTVIEYSMSPWNISGLSWVQEKDISGQETSPSAIFWSANGDRLFIAGDGDNDIVAFSITTEWDIGGISWFQDFGTDIDAPTGLHFSSDGRRMYVMDGSAEDDIHEFHLSDPWMISTARLVNLFDVSGENASPQGIFVVQDNSKIFMVGTGTPDGVYGYDLGLEINGAILANGGLTAGGVVKMNNLLVVDPSDTGVLWNDNGTMKISAG